MEMFSHVWMTSTSGSECTALPTSTVQLPTEPRLDSVVPPIWLKEDVVAEDVGAAGDAPAQAAAKTQKPMTTFLM